MPGQQKREKRSEAGKEGKPTQNGASLSGPQPHKIMQPVAWVQLCRATLPWKVPSKKGRERNWSAALFPGSLTEVCPAESSDSWMHRLWYPSPSGQPFGKRGSHFTLEGSSKPCLLKLGHQRCCTFHHGGYSTLSKKSRPGGQTGPRECGRHINWVQDIHCLSPFRLP